MRMIPRGKKRPSLDSRNENLGGFHLPFAEVR